MPRVPTKVTNELKPVIDDLSRIVVSLNTDWVEIDQPLFDAQIKQIRTLMTEMRRIAMRAMPPTERERHRQIRKQEPPT